MKKFFLFVVFLLLGLFVIDERQEEEELYRATLQLWLGVAEE